MRLGRLALVLAFSAAFAATPTVEVAAPEGPSHLPAPMDLSREEAPRPKQPEFRSERDRWVWELISRYAELYGVEDKAPLIFGVIRTESGFRPEAVSPCRRYYGMCQFTRSTFAMAVGQMKRLGLLHQNAVLDPMDPDHAVHVMTWMWSQGLHNHWGPARRFFRKLAREQAKATRGSAATGP